MRDRFCSVQLDSVLFYLLVFLVINPISYARISSLFIFLGFLFWLIFAYAKNTSKIRKIIGNPVFLTSCIFPITLIFFSWRADVIFEKRCILDSMIVMLMLFYFHSDRNSIHIKSSFILGYLFIIAIYSSYMLLQDPMISRLMAGEADVYGNSLTGGYNTVYGVMIFTLGLLGVALRKEKGSTKYYLFAFCFFIFVLLSKYVIALVMLIIGGVAVLSEHSRFLRITIFVMAFLILFTFLFYPFFLQSISFAISDLFPQGDFEGNRWHQIGDLIIQFRTGNFTSNTSLSPVTRIDLYKQTFDAFVSNPFWGVGNTGTAMYNAGEHATVLDNLLSMGL